MAWFQHEFLDAPVQDLGDVDFVFRGAGDSVDPAELAELLASPAEHSENFSVETKFVDAAREGVGSKEHWIGAGSDAECPWRAGGHRPGCRGGFVADSGASVGGRGNADRPCQDLPLLAQRNVEVGRALMTRPIALLLDEPTAGATVSEREILAKLIGDLRASGVSLVLIEHNVPFVMSVSTHVVVMHFGKVVADGTPESVAADPVVQEIYLGG